MNQLTLFPAKQPAFPARSGPYKSFCAATAQRIILEQLQRADGQWVRRRILRRATGMDPRDISGVLRHLAEAQAIELTDELELIHPMHGFMGHTRGARIAAAGQISNEVAA